MNSGPILLKITMPVYWSDKQVILLWCHQELLIFHVLSLWTGKTPKNYYGSLLPSTTISFYLHLDVLGAFHVWEDLFANFSTFYRKALKSPWQYPFNVNFYCTIVIITVVTIVVSSIISFQKINLTNWFSLAVVTLWLILFIQLCFIFLEPKYWLGATT